MTSIEHPDDVSRRLADPALRAAFDADYQSVYLKMHGNRASNLALLEAVLAGIGGLQGVECAVCVPFPYLGEIAVRLSGTPLAWGAQNLSEHAQGAYTGEVSAAMLAEFGCRYVLVGHSERRQLYGEQDAQVAAKFAAARAQGMDVVVAAIREETFPEIEARGAASGYGSAPWDSPNRSSRHRRRSRGSARSRTSSSISPERAARAARRL